MITYIRDYMQNKSPKLKRQTSHSSDILIPLPSNTSHQDVIRYSGLENNTSLIYTVGKQFLLKNYRESRTNHRWVITYVAKGSIYCGDQKLSPGDFAVIPPTCPNILYTKNDNVLYYWCTTNDPTAIGLLALCGYSDGKIVTGHTDRSDLVEESFEKIIYNFPQNCSERVHMIGSLACLFSLISKNVAKATTDQQAQPLFKRCVDYIGYCSGVITVGELTGRYFISRRYLYTLFQKYMNTSPMDYILSVRMKAATKYLTTTNLTVAHIAELMGYSDYNHFSRAYQKYYSVLPSRMRKENTASKTADD